MSPCNQLHNIINEILQSYHIKSSKSRVYVTLPAHHNLDQLHFTCVIHSHMQAGSDHHFGESRSRGVK